MRRWRWVREDLRRPRVGGVRLAGSEVWEGCCDWFCGLEV
jgi:hypothetical protein